MSDTDDVTVAYSGWDYDAGWCIQNDVHEKRTRVPAALWERYQSAARGLASAVAILDGIGDEISTTGVGIEPLCRHSNVGYRWSRDEGLFAVCACGETFPWDRECPHPVHVSEDERDLCGVCGASLPYVVVPLVGGPRDGQDTRLHHKPGEDPWRPYSYQLYCCTDGDGAHNYALRSNDGVLTFEFVRTV